jgi:hypothetical protein
VQWHWNKWGFYGGSEEDRAFVESSAASRPQPTENRLLDLPGEKIGSANVCKCLAAAKLKYDDDYYDGDDDDADDGCNSSNDTASFDLCSLR